MDTLADFDSQSRSQDLTTSVLLEFKRQAGQEDVRPRWIFWAGRRLKTRWVQLIPLICLLAFGATVPMFLLTLGLLLVCMALAIAGFMLFVQLPIGYLARCWHGLRQSSAKSAEVSLTRESSSGI